MEESIQSFIIRIWAERVAEDEATLHWRGHVTHVAEGQRHDIESLAELETFIARYIHAWETPSR